MPHVPHSDELGALARAPAGTTRILADWFGLAHSAPTSDVHCRHPSTGAATPATASATRAPHEAGHGVTRILRATAPSPGLGAKTCTPGTSATLPYPTTRIASAHRPSRELGPLHPYPCASSYSTARVEPRPGVTETAPAALREKLVPMRDTPDRQLQLDFQRRAPEPAPIAPTSRPERAPRFHDARLTSATGTGLGYRRFLPIRTAAPAASDAPFPLPRRRVNDTGLKCELGTPSSRSTAASPPLADTTRWLAARPRRQPQPTACPNEHDNTHRHLQSTQSPSTLTNDRYPALHRFSRRSVAPRGAPAVRNRTDRSVRSQRRARHGSRLWLLNWTSRHRRRPRYPGG